MTLRLYVAGNSPRSRRAIETVTRLVGRRLDREVHLEIIDIYQQTERATQEQIIGVPALVRELSESLRLLVGDLSDENRLLVALRLDELTSDDLA